jgi:hypothetical protein
MVNWLKNLVVNTAMRELAEDASVATGETVDPLAIDVESKPVKKLGVKKK